MRLTHLLAATFAALTLGAVGCDAPTDDIDGLQTGEATLHEGGQAERPDGRGEQPDACVAACEELALATAERCVEDGADARRCAEQGRATLERCVQGRCVRPEPEPQPDPEPEDLPCRDACGQRGRQLYADCVERGGEQEACGERAHLFIHQCLADNCERPEPPPEEEQPDCATACAQRGRTIFGECMERADDEAACAERARIFVADCLAQRCEAPEPPPQEERPECAEACGLRGRQLYTDCMERADDEEACAERARAYVGECLAEHCERPEPPPEEEPFDCPSACAERGRHVFADCMERADDEEACAERARAYVGECLAEHCERPEPPPEEEPIDCPTACGERGRQLFADCMERADDEEACAERARAYVEECVTERCDRPEPPPEDELPECAERCALAARTALQECLETGRDEEVCAEHARGLMRTCVERTCRRPDPEEPVPCAERCGLAGRGVFEECLEEGGAEQRCALRARAFVQECRTQRCERPERPERPQPPCAEACELRARHTMAECLETGAAPERCAARVRPLLEECLAEHCERPEPDADECGEACAGRARHALEECLEAGGDEEGCAARARALATTCREERCEASEPRPEPQPRCSTHCRARGAELFLRCTLAEPREPRECVERVRQAVAECVELHCAER